MVMKNKIKLVLKFMKLFLFFLITCSIVAYIYKYIVYHTPFTDYNVVKDFDVFIPICFASTIGQFMKKDKTNK
jgi:hypothetical protein